MNILDSQKPLWRMVNVTICSELQCFDNRMKYTRVNIKTHSNTEEIHWFLHNNLRIILFQRVCPYAFSMNFLTKAVKCNKRQVTKLNYQKTKQSTAKFMAYSIKCYVHIKLILISTKISRGIDSFAFKR